MVVELVSSKIKFITYLILLALLKPKPMSVGGESVLILFSGKSILLRTTIDEYKTRYTKNIPCGFEQSKIIPIT